MIDWNNCDIGELNLSRKKELLNCPNCGAPIESEKCPYCGTVFIDFATMDAKQPFYIKIKQDDNVYIFKVCLRSAELKQEDDVFCGFHEYNRWYPLYRSLEMEFDVL